MPRTREYVDYLFDHIGAFRKCYPIAAKIVQDVTGDHSFDPDLIPAHDNDKFEPDNFRDYLAYLYPTKGPYNKDGWSADKEIARKFNFAWGQHQKRNPHHWQYWICIHGSGDLEAFEMPNNYIAEMLADWATFTYLKGSSTIKWYNAHKKMILNEETRKIVELCLPRLEVRIQGLRKGQKPSL